MARARKPFVPNSAKKEPKADPTRDRAWRAVRKFNQMTSTLTGFARALTGNQQVVVRAGNLTSTDGRFINIVPPLALGDEVIHERGLCNDRGEDGQQLCPACNLGEKVMRRIYHEMAHITGDTMQAPSSGVRARLYDLVDEWHPSEACSHGSSIKRDINNSGSYITAARAIHPYAEMIIAALEDARIDGRMLRVRPGLRKSFYAATYDTFVNGIETKSGELKYWREAPMTAQIVIGFTLKGANYMIDDDWLSPAVQDILEVPELRELVMAATAGQDVHEAMLKAIDMFRLLHKMGLLDADKCEVQPPSLKKPGEEGEKSGEPIESDESDSSDGSGEDASSSDSSDGDADSDSGSDGSGEPQEESTDADGTTGADDDATGDGSPGDTASDGAFGDDFENEEHADGDTQSGQTGSEETGSDDQTSEEEAVAGSGSDGGDSSADSSDNESDDEAGSESDTESEGCEAADGAGDSGASEPGGRSDRGDQDESDDDADAEEGVKTDEASRVPEAESDTEAEVEDDDSDNEGVDEHDDSYVEPVGEGVWDEDVPESKTSDFYSEVEPGTLDEVQEALEMFHPHQAYEGADVELGIEEADGEGGDDHKHVSAASAAVQQALTQSEYFDRSSEEVGGVDICQFPLPSMNWMDDGRIKPEDFMPAESVIGKALMQGRIVFAANKRSKNEQNLKSGKINARMLGKRAPFADERMFKQRQLPGKRDYIVGITVDCSGSTQVAYRMERIKRAVFAKAELLNRLGVKFYITGHTGWYSSALKGGRFSVYEDDIESAMTSLWILNIKGVDEAWNDETRKRLANLKPMAENYDGHTLEYHRKQLEDRTETDKILIYYTDGAMPAANYDEEYSILTEEIATCKKKNITLMAVGINTSSPEAHGFDTVRVDSDEDLDKVVAHLKRRLLG